ncbi:MAG: xylulokinase, partial [Actinobacteria bacterium]|nr:xylulokinase [Actinomycetota bacterium]
MTLLAGVDVGTSSVKGLLVAADDGTVVARAEAEHPLSTPQPGWAEQDPADWWAGAQAVLRSLQDAGEIAGIGLTGQMHGLVALDGGGRVLRPAMLWNDGRTGAECAEIEQRFGLDALIAQTGNRALPGFTAPKLRWLARHEPGVYAQIEHVLLPKDYVRLRLCGEHATDVADASGTLLFDVAQRRWSESVAAALEVDPAWLPRALESPHLSGVTTGGIPVAAGAGDQAAGALGVGIDRPGPASVVLGTSGVIFTASDAFAADPAARVHAFCHAVPGAWHSMGVMLSAAGSLRWLRDVAAPGSDYAALIADAERWEPGVEGLTFLPYLAGERTPHADPAARGSFTGLSLRHDRGALVRAVLEGVAFGLRDGLDLVCETSSAPARPVLGRVSGGGARSRLWLEILASVLELPLQRMAVDEGASFGAALLGWGEGAADEAVSHRACSLASPYCRRRLGRRHTFDTSAGVSERLVSETASTGGSLGQHVVGVERHHRDDRRDRYQRDPASLGLHVVEPPVVVSGAPPAGGRHSRQRDADRRGATGEVAREKME